MEYVTLNNGVKMPKLGYGVYQVTPEECERCVSDALAARYRSIDTAQAYFNEEGVGNAVKKSELVAFADLLSEAVYRFEIEDFPCVVAIDCRGGNIYKKGQGENI